MARVDGLLAGLLARELRTQKLITTLLEEVFGVSSDEADDVEEIWIASGSLKTFTRRCAPNLSKLPPRLMHMYVWPGTKPTPKNWAAPAAGNTHTPTI